MDVRSPFVLFFEFFIFRSQKISFLNDFGVFKHTIFVSALFFHFSMHILQSIFNLFEDSFFYCGYYCFQGRLFWRLNVVSFAAAFLQTI